jgi:hypothetical protein
MAMFSNILNRWESAELNQEEAAELLGVSSRERGFAPIDTPLDLERPILRVLSAPDVSLTYFPFRRTWTRQEPELSFVIVAKACAPRVHRAVELPDKGSHDSVEKSAHGP